MTAPHSPGTWLLIEPAAHGDTCHIGRVENVWVIETDADGVRRSRPLEPGEDIDPERLAYDMSATTWRRSRDLWLHRLSRPVDRPADLAPALASPHAHVRQLALRAAAALSAP